MFLPLPAGVVLKLIWSLSFFDGFFPFFLSFSTTVPGAPQLEKVRSGMPTLRLLGRAGQLERAELLRGAHEALPGLRTRKRGHCTGRQCVVDVAGRVAVHAGERPGLLQVEIGRGYGLTRVPRGGTDVAFLGRHGGGLRGGREARPARRASRARSSVCGTSCGPLLVRALPRGFACVIGSWLSLGSGCLWVAVCSMSNRHRPRWGRTANRQKRQRHGVSNVTLRIPHAILLCAPRR